MKVQNITLKHTTSITVIILTVVWLPTLPNLHFLIQMNKISKNNLLYKTEYAKDVIFCVKQWRNSKSGECKIGSRHKLWSRNSIVKYTLIYQAPYKKKSKSEAFDKLSESRGFSLKAVSATFLLVCFVYLKESTCETSKNTFYFTSKAPLVLEIIKF